MNQVTVALMGTGGIQGKHWRTFAKRDDVKIVALCDVGQAQVQAFMDRMGVDPAEPDAPAVFTDSAAMYEQAKPDAVVIATPHTLHFEHAMQAIRAGVHVLMEKPMVTDSGQARELDQAVRQSGKILAVGYNTSCTPEFAYIREAIRDERFGPLQVVTGYIAQGWMKGTTGKWRQDPGLSGGGFAYDSGAHLFNSLCWSVQSRVAEVFAFVDNKDTPVDINSSVTVRFESGAFAAIGLSGNCPAIGARMSYMFADGRIDVDPWNPGWLEVWDGGKKIRYPRVTEPELDPGDNFIDAVLGRDAPRTTPSDGIIQSELMDLIYESARTHQPAKAKAL